MNPDNPTFRTPEEERRAAQLVALTARVAKLTRALEQIANPLPVSRHTVGDQVVEQFRDPREVARKVLDD